MSYFFDGLDDRIQWGNAFANWPTTSTVLAWVRPSSIASSFATAISAYGNQHGIGQFPGGSSHCIRYVSTWSDAAGVWRTADDTCPLNQWMGIAASYDASSASNDPILYKKPEGGSITTVAVAAKDAPAGTFSASINDLWSGGIYGSFMLSGRLAYVRIFGSILDQTAVDLEFASETAVASSPLLDAPLTADANDISGNGRNGTVTGAVLDGMNPTLSGAPPAANKAYADQMRRFFTAFGT